MKQFVAVCGSVKRNKKTLLETARLLEKVGYTPKLPPFNIHPDHDQTYAVRTVKDNNTNSHRVTKYDKSGIERPDMRLMTGAEIERITTSWWWDILAWCDMVVFIIEPPVGMNTFSDLVVALYMEKDVYVRGEWRPTNRDGKLGEWWAELVGVHGNHIKDFRQIDSKLDGFQ